MLEVLAVDAVELVVAAILEPVLLIERLLALAEEATTLPAAVSVLQSAM